MAVKLYEGAKLTEVNTGVEWEVVARKGLKHIIKNGGEVRVIKQSLLGKIYKESEK
jgi:hypothetical protein